MINDDDRRSRKKPVPLPRKSLIKQKSSSEKEADDESEDNSVADKRTDEKNFIKGDWKSASESLILEKKRLMKNEVNKLEKSVKSIISRRSNQSKCHDPSTSDECGKSDPLPDGSVFFNISFNSPLVEESNLGENLTDKSLDDCCDESDFSLPPPYPAPPLPDESVYDQMRSFNPSELEPPKVTSCDSSNINLPSCKSIKPDWSASSKCESNKKEDISKNGSSFCQNEKNNNERYEIIYESLARDKAKDRYTCLEAAPKNLETQWQSREDKLIKIKNDKPQESHIKYIIHLFDPLQENEICTSGLKASENSNLFKSASSCSAEFKNEPLKNSGKINVPPGIFPTSSKETNIIPSNLQEGNYGKIIKNTNAVNKSPKVLERSSFVEPPPIPPRDPTKICRPLPENETKAEKWNEPKPEQPQQESDTSNLPDEKSKETDVTQWTSLKRVVKKVAGNIEHRTSYLSFSGKKPSKPSGEEFFSNMLSKSKSSCSDSNICQLPQNFPKHSGIIYRPGVERWGVLSQRKLTLFANKDSPDVKEIVHMSNVLSIQAAQNKISGETIGVHCFEISVSSKNQTLLFGVPSISERHIWMRKLLESIGPGFSAKLSMDYAKAGWCYAKESISCIWSKYCILLHHRNLYLSSELGSFTEADLRKARNITLQAEGFTCEKATEKGPLLLIDLQDKTFYLQMDFERETRAWELAIASAALKNGPSLGEQQLTKDDVPAIVDKCLNFVHTHGIFSEGIYRRSGSNRTVSQLLALFRCNAWSVKLSREECTEFDVSSALKRFFRDLPEPLLLSDLQEELGRISDVSDAKEKIDLYRIALKKLPAINYLTARRLLCHLYFIDKQKDQNLMGAENLAAIWGPTILQIQEQVSLDSDCFKMETSIVNDLICYYPEIFEVEQAEVERETKILQMLEKYYSNSNNLNKKPSGELKIWIYLHSYKNADDCINVSINPQKTAEEVCKELSYRTNEFVYSLCLEEVIGSGHLTRPLNHSEKVLDTVLRWSYWDESDRKDNCLVLTENELFRKVVQYAKYPIIFSEELKYADQKSKCFKSCQFEFSHAKLICYKDKSKMAEWKIEDIVWYFGHEPKRVPHAKWSITFIEKQFIAPRTKEKPYFGNTICGSSEEQKLKLVTAMLMAQYSSHTLPTPNLME